jgi:hypothetical protein
MNRKQVIFAENSDIFALLPMRKVHGQGAFISAVFMARDFLQTFFHMPEPLTSSAMGREKITVT